MSSYYIKLSEAAEYIKSRIGATPHIGIILGSGLGQLADEIENPVDIEYKVIPYFPLSTVKGHAGRLVSGVIGGKAVVALKGRFHYYEGYDASQIVFPVRVLKMLGIENLVVTNAAGGINRDFNPGDLMLVKDHIGLFAPSPLRGENIDEFGVRFPDMNEAYSRELIQLAKNTSHELGIELKEGVYAFAKGPMYETPAEIRALGLIGADAVGMSTVPEVITAHHSGIKVLGISLITNKAAGIEHSALDHEKVIEAARRSEVRFAALVKTMIKEIGI